MVLSDRHRYALVLALASILILVLGIWLKPTAKAGSQHTENASVTRAELENLQQLIRRNSLRNLSTSFSNLAEGTISYIARVQPWNVNAVMVEGIGLIVAKRLDSVPRSISAASGSNVGKTSPVSVDVWIPGLPFVIGRIPSNNPLSFAKSSDSTPAQGAWVLVVANGVFGQTLMSPGIYNGITQAECGPYIDYRLLTTVPLDNTYMGGGLFDLSGDLQGVVLPCDDGPAIVPVSEIQRAMASVNNDGGRTLAKYGFQLANPKADDETGVLVTEVWEQWPASHAGIEPADELIAIDGQSIALPHDALAILLQPGTTSHQVAVRRGHRSFTANLATTLNNSAETHPAVTVEDQPGLAIANVSKGSSADRAGLRIGDRVLSIDGRRATKDKLQQAFADFHVSNPFEVVVQRPGRRTLFTVRP